MKEDTALVITHVIIYVSREKCGMMRSSLVPIQLVILQENRKNIIN